MPALHPHAQLQCAEGRERSHEERAATADKFRSGRGLVMFSSDVSARGVHYEGVTAVVPFATLVADRLALPLVYVRPQPKSHGTGGQIEGGEVKDRKVVLVEDLITSGTSIALFTSTLRGAGATIEHASLVFARMTEAAQPALDQLDMRISVLCDMDTLLALAEEEGVADAAAIAEVRAYLADAEGWSLAHPLPEPKE